MEFPPILGAGADEESQLESDEGHGRARPHRHAQDAPGVGVESGGDVERQYGRALGVERRNGLGPAPRHRTLQPGTEQCVDIEIGLARQTETVLDDTAGVAIGRQTQCRLTARPIRPAQLQHPHIQAIGARQPCHHIAIAAIVARSGQDGEAARIRPALAQQPIGDRAGALHQFDPRDTETLAGQTIEPAHLFGAVECMGQTIAVRKRAVQAGEPHSLPPLSRLRRFAETP